MTNQYINLSVLINYSNYLIKFLSIFYFFIKILKVLILFVFLYHLDFKKFESIKFSLHLIIRQQFNIRFNLRYMF